MIAFFLIKENAAKTDRRLDIMHSDSYIFQ